MIGLILRRLVFGVVTLLLVSVVVFGATQALSGDAATSILGQTATPERLAALREQLNLDDPVWRQYTDWLGGVFTGDLGDSVATQKPVTQLLGGRVGRSAFLVALVALVAVPLSLALGVVSALRRDRALDHIVSAASLGLAALPEFVIGMALILVFATGVFHILPAVSLVDQETPIWRQLDVVVLPAVTLILAVFPYISRIMRASTIEVLESEYVQMARLKGLSERRIILRHVLPNSIAPAIQVTALQLAWLAGGVVVVEFVFRFPGIGEALVDAVRNRDIPVVQALTLLAGAIYVGLNLIADIGTILVTPKVRTALR